MAVKVNVGGSWKTASTVKVNVGGTWKEAQNVYVNVNGAWKPAFTYSYSYGSWSSCSASCGTGTQTRTATCYRNGTTAVADKFCTNAGVSKGSTSQSCYLQACWDGLAALAPVDSLKLSGSTVYNVGGRSVYRHTSNKGSVITWMDKSGTVHRTLVLDSPYRYRGKLWGEGANPTGIAIYANTYYYLGTGTTDSSSSYKTTAAFDTASSSFTDSIINAYSCYFEDANTSLYNTSKIVEYWPSGDYAAHFCRNNGSGISADLPNLQTLIRVFLCAEKIDALDPYASSNSTLKLSGWMDNFKIWSSTLYGVDSLGNYNSWHIYYYGAVSRNSQGNAGCSFGVAPILEV